MKALAHGLVLCLSIFLLSIPASFEAIAAPEPIMLGVVSDLSLPNVRDCRKLQRFRCRDEGRLFEVPACCDGLNFGMLQHDSRP